MHMQPSAQPRGQVLLLVESFPLLLHVSPNHGQNPLILDYRETWYVLQEHKCCVKNTAVPGIERNGDTSTYLPRYDSTWSLVDDRGARTAGPQAGVAMAL